MRITIVFAEVEKIKSGGKMLIWKRDAVPDDKLHNGEIAGDEYIDELIRSGLHFIVPIDAARTLHPQDIPGCIAPRDEGISGGPGRFGIEACHTAKRNRTAHKITGQLHNSIRICCHLLPIIQPHTAGMPRLENRRKPGLRQSREKQECC